ncbi:Glycosyltransferase AER61 [Raphanus sativus]|nr:Glycosyltransferase AER61 [Raphanus sativus]
MGHWLSQILTATYGQEPEIIHFVDENKPVCFEKAVVMRHNEGGMSRERRLEVFDHLRCKARNYCNINSAETSKPRIGMTLLLRTGARSFKNESAVINVFKRECERVDGCVLNVSYSNNLTFCEQVELMKKTDVLVSPHGAQLTNLFLMDRNSSVMEFFPKGWLKLAGVGQRVFQWEANWSGMRHEGAWHDSFGETCKFPDTDRRCMSLVYKNAMIGYNETYFGEWARLVLSKVPEHSKGYGSLDGTEPEMGASQFVEKGASQFMEMQQGEWSDNSLAEKIALLSRTCSLCYYPLSPFRYIISFISLAKLEPYYQILCLPQALRFRLNFFALTTAIVETTPSFRFLLLRDSQLRRYQSEF